MLLVASIGLGTSSETAGDKPEGKVGTTSDHHAPYDLGYYMLTMDGTTSRELARGQANLFKTVLSSDCRLQLACTKSES